MRQLKARIVVFSALTAGLLCGCEAPGFLTGHRNAPAPIVDHSTADLNPILAALEMMSELPQRDPARQAEIFQAARNAAELTPTTSNKLKYALALATPGHGGADPVAAQRQLSEILATPENLLPIERYLAQSQLKQVERQMLLGTENQRLRDELPRESRDKLASISRRLAAETDENAKLRKELDEARAKLDAISHIERSINDRSTTGAGSAKP
ncbi:MAG: hypothetical protein ACHQIL_12660 [Steroidobacterales bacterium]